MCSNQVALTDPIEERPLLLLEPVERLAPGEARQRNFQRGVEQKRQIGLQVPMDKLLERLELGQIQLTAPPLISEGRIREAIAQYPGARGQRRPDHAREVLLAGREHQQGFRERVHLIFRDAREVLLATDQTYDIIFSEPSNPYRIGVASLFRHLRLLGTNPANWTSNPIG